MNYEKLTHKKNQLDKFRPLAKELVHNLEEWFRVELTYTSNAIEGNTLTRRETAIVIEKGLTIGGKSLKEHLEATNHAFALDFIHSLVKNNPSELSNKDTLKIHEIILKSIDDENAGRYRNVSVRISGSGVILPNPRKVHDLMEEFHSWLTAKHNLHPVEFAGIAHYKLVTIHPFIDGNGRAARLLMNLLLLMNGYPPAIIRKKDRLAYIGSLEKAQLGGSREEYDKIIADSVNRSLDIYLNALQNKPEKDDIDNDNLLRIGELAKQTGEVISTIRYWTKQGLLEVAEFSESGYQFYNYDMIKRVELIKKLKNYRLTLEEIKANLTTPIITKS